MNPEKFRIEIRSLENLGKDKSTQTSAILLNSLLPPSSLKTVDKADKGSVTVFEFCHIVQDPDCPGSITIIKESVTEETKPHPTSSSREGLANRFKYCKEIIKPYLKYRLDGLECEEDLLQEALQSAEEDFPDYQPISEIFEEEKFKKYQTEQSDTSSVAKVDAFTSYCSMNYKDSTVEEPSSLQKLHNLDGPPTEAQNCTSLSENKSCTNLKCTIKGSAENASKHKCSNEVLNDGLKPDSLIQNLEPVVVLAASDETKENDDTGPENEEEEEEVEECKCGLEKSFLEAHNEAIATIKLAVEDFIGKVYKSTQEAVSTSAKEVVKSKVSSIFNSNKQGTENESKSSDTLTKFGIFGKSGDSEENGSDVVLGPGTAAIAKIITKVDSAVTIISEHLSKSLDNFPDNMMPSNFNNKSSPYDIPKPPTDVTHKFLPEPEPAPNSVFSVIKSKIISMFSDNKAKIAEVPLFDKPSLLSPNEEDSDDGDPIQNIIE